MRNRLSSIVTRTGDAGTTGLGDGSRVGKDSLRIDTIGEVDELNSSLGLLLTEALPAHLRSMLVQVQNELFDLGGELCMPGREVINETHITALEKFAGELNASLSPLREFILPGGIKAAALAHLSRAICRRAERSLIRLHKTEPVSESVRQYINRLSDLFFILARFLNHAAEQPDVIWANSRQKS